MIESSRHRHEARGIVARRAVLHKLIPVRILFGVARRARGAKQFVAFRLMAPFARHRDVLSYQRETRCRMIKELVAPCGRIMTHLALRNSIFVGERRIVRIYVGVTSFTRGIREFETRSGVC